MLDSGQREQRYFAQRYWHTPEFFRVAIEKDWQPTGPQRRRMKHKANKASGDAPRSRRQRLIRSLQTKLQPKPAEAKEALQRLQERRAGRDPQSGTAQEIARRQRLRETPASTKELLKVKPVEYRQCPVESCLAYGEWEFNPCRTASGNRAAKPHKGRYDDGA